MNCNYKYSVLGLLIFVILFSSSCDLINSDKNDENLVELVDGLPKNIRDFVSEEELDILEETLDVKIYRGNKPPKLDGSYRFSRTILKKTNIVNDISIGTQFTDRYIKFYNQNDDLTLDVDVIATDPSSGVIRSEGLGQGSFLAGDGQSFSIFYRNSFTTDRGESGEMLELFSGILDTDGIQNFEFAILMLDNNGHTSLIDNGKGRSFYDSDGFSEEAPMPNPKTAESFVDQDGFKSVLPSMINRYTNRHKNK